MDKFKESIEMFREKLEAVSTEIKVCERRMHEFSSVLRKKYKTSPNKAKQRLSSIDEELAKLEKKEKAFHREAESILDGVYDELDRKGS